MKSEFMTTAYIKFLKENYLDYFKPNTKIHKLSTKPIVSSTGKFIKIKEIVTGERLFDEKGNKTIKDDSQRERYTDPDTNIYTALYFLISELVVMNRWNESNVNDFISFIDEHLHEYGRYDGNEMAIKVPIQDSHLLPQEQLLFKTIPDITFLFKFFIQDKIITEQQKKIDELERQTPSLFHNYDMVNLNQQTSFKASNDKFLPNLKMIDDIRSKYPHLLDAELESGENFGELLDKIDKTISNMSFSDYENFINLFAFIETVRNSVDNSLSIQKTGPNEILNDWFYIKVVSNKHFFKYFLDDNEIGQTEHRRKILKWLHNNQKITLPIIDHINGEIYPIEFSLYQYAGSVSKSTNKSILLSINMKLFSDFKSKYVELSTEEITEIKKLWNEIENSKEYQELNNNRAPLSSYKDLIIRFYIDVLKRSIHKDNIKCDGDQYYYLIERGQESFHLLLGNPKKRMNDTFKKAKTKNLTDEYYKFIMGEIVYPIAVKLGWILDLPEKRAGKKEDIIIFKANFEHFASFTDKQMIEVKRNM